MDIGDIVLMSGLSLPSGVELPALIQEDENDMPIVSVHAGHSADAEEEEGEGEAEVGEE